MAYKRRLKFDKRIKHKKRMDRLFILVIVCFAFLGIGYSYISTSLNINGTANVTAASWDVHFDNLNVTDGSVTATTPANIIEDTTIEFAATLEEPGDFYEFTVDVVNSGTMDAMIDAFGISPELTSDQQKYLEYTVTYSDGVELEEKQELKVGTTETLKVRFSYIENEDKTNYPTEDQTFNISFSMDYTQADGSEIEVAHPHPVSFADDDFATIVAAVKAGNTSNYNVGDTKTVDMGTFGSHTLRIANKSTPSECSTTGFSQTACGFVLEFVDVVIKHRMNPYTSGVTTNGNGNIGGWEYSEMRTYVNSNIYNALPTELRDGIINTTVVSGYGANDTANFVTTDKLYLLSSHEVYEDVDGEPSAGLNYYDTAYDNTRQLDYYDSINVSTANANGDAGAKKQFNGSMCWWWLRSGVTSGAYNFYIIGSTGMWMTNTSYDSYGVSPAFRIG